MTPPRRIYEDQQTGRFWYAPETGDMTTTGDHVTWRDREQDGVLWRYIDVAEIPDTNEANESARRFLDDELRKVMDGPGSAFIERATRGGWFIDPATGTPLPPGEGGNVWGGTLVELGIDCEKCRGVGQFTHVMALENDHGGRWLMSWPNVWLREDPTSGHLEPVRPLLLSPSKAEHLFNAPGGIRCMIAPEQAVDLGRVRFSYDPYLTDPQVFPSFRGRYRFRCPSCLAGPVVLTPATCVELVFGFHGAGIPQVSVQQLERAAGAIPRQKRR